MNKLTPRIVMLSLVAVLFTSCEIIGDIFQAGMGVGIFLVIAVIAVIFFAISKISGK